MLDIQEKEFEKVHADAFYSERGNWDSNPSLSAESLTLCSHGFCWSTVQVCDCDDGAASVHH